MVNYYKDLNIGYDATEKEIKNAYRSLAKKYHPDLNQGDPQAGLKFKKVTTAYDVLLNDDLRDEHDILLQASGIVFAHIKAEDTASAPTQAKPTVQNKPVVKTKEQVRAERRAAAMRKVQEAKRFTRRVIIIVACLVIGAITIGTVLAINSSTTKYVAVTYDLNYGGHTVTEQVEVGSYLVRPEDPTREGYTFDQWCADSDLTVAWRFDDIKVSADTTLYASWHEIKEVVEMPITLNYNGATGNCDTESVTVVKDDYGSIGVKPTRTGYTFAGWYSDESLTTLMQGINDSTSRKMWTNETNVYAGWTANNIEVKVNVVVGGEDQVYNTTIAYDSESGSQVLPISITANLQGTAGFYDAEDGGNMIIDATGKLVVDFKYASSLILYAKYE